MMYDQIVVIVIQNSDTGYNIPCFLKFQFKANIRKDGPSHPLRSIVNIASVLSVADNFEIGPFNRRLLWGAEHARIKVEDGFRHRDFEIDLVILSECRDLQVAKLHVVLIEPPSRARDKTTAQMSVLVNIGKNEALRFASDR